MRALLAAMALMACATPVRAEDHLAPLAFLHGCWIGTFDGPQALRDERCFESTLNGHMLRDTHTVLGVGYGGETSYVWNAETQRIEVYYVANDGGLMTGRVERDADGVLWMREGRYVGADGGVQQLRSRWVRNGADAFTVVTEREENGVWAPLMTIAYERAHIGE